jgi:hypothetical protein
MHAELQRIVDRVAARVNRPALIEDRRQRVVVYSEHTGLIDGVRRSSILRRHTTPEVIAWARDIGIMEARKPVRTPACPELDLLPRVCVPIRHQDLLLGFVWFIDAADGMTDDDISAVTGVMPDLSLALYRENLLGELTSQREAEATRTLLVEAPEARREAVRSLLTDGVLASDGEATALVAHLVVTPDGLLDDLARTVLENALVATRRWIGLRESLHLVRHDHGVLLLCGQRSTGRVSAADAALRLDHTLRGIRELTSVARTVIGVGDPRTRLYDSVLSYQEAFQAARVGTHLPALGPVVSWSELGIYRLLSGVDARHLDVARVHPGLGRLLGDEAHQVLLETLETYLDLAGNAHATAERLRLHRTTLYYRLQRVESLADTDLKDGNERLCLHLALKLGRLTGRYQLGP